MMSRFSISMRVAACLVAALGLSLGCQGSGCGGDGEVARDGPRLEYAIDFEDAIGKYLRAQGERLAHEVGERHEEAEIDVAYEDGLVVRTSGAEETALVEEVVGKQFSDLERVDRSEGELRFELSDAGVRRYRSTFTLEIVQSINGALDNRGFGDAQALQYGDSGVIVEVPDWPDEKIEGTKAVVEDFQSLRFLLADDERADSFFGGLEGELPDGSRLCEIHGVPSVVREGRVEAREQMKSFFEGRVPEDHIVGYEFVEKEDEKTDEDKRAERREAAEESAVLGDDYVDGEEGQKCPPESTHWRTHLLEEEAHLEGRHVLDAQVAIDERIQAPVVRVQFTEEGTELLEELTTRHTNRRVAAVVGNDVHIAANIAEPVPGGRMQFSLSMLAGYGERQQQASDLTNLLRVQSAPYELELEKVHPAEE